MASLFLTRLVQRKTLRVSGPDCYSYLQGLLSNDLRNLYEPDRISKRKHARATPSVMSTFMLNAQGKATEPDELLIECDSSIASGLANTLYGYRVRRKIAISMEDDLSVWCLFPSYENSRLDLISTTESSLLNSKSTETSEVVADNLTVVNDPRLSSMGMRIITRSTEFSQVKKSIQSMIDAEIINCPHSKYTLFRYLLGVGEGVKDHPESNCLPLECNADFLGSVSFTKGCYLGQELTARIHYTGVIRKRLMPVVIDLKSGANEVDEVPLVEGTEIIDQESKKKMGLLRKVVKNRALALLRHNLITDSTQLIHEGTKAKISAYIPYWWNLS